MLNALMSFMSYSYSYGSDYGYDYGYSDYDISGAEAAGAAAGVFAIMGFMLLPAIIIGIVSIIANWKIFTKMGLEGWKSIIPIYNIIVMYDGKQIMTAERGSFDTEKILQASVTGRA